MNLFKKRIIAVAAALMLLPNTALLASPDEPSQDEPNVQKVEVKVDASDILGPFNRNLFSVAGFAQLDQYGAELAKESLHRLQLPGTQARIETMMDQAFPEKDVFVPVQMFRFVDNTKDAYYRKITDSGMEPVLLLAYNMSWLSENGYLNEPPTDPHAWAESAAKIIEHYNGSGDNYKLNVKYVEIWNEPNLTMFWSTGEWERYFELFNIVADLIHERFPGVKVGGPAFSPAVKPVEFGKAFIDHSGERMDFFVYHSYGDSVEKIDQDVTMWEDYIRERTGKEPKLMVTESENFFRGHRKIDYIMERQFTLLNHADTMIGYHHFTLMEYKEGWYTFGLINQDGSVIGENFWPYWLFRDSRGNIAISEVELKPRPSQDDFRPMHVATVSEDGKEINLVYYSGSTGDQSGYDTKFLFKLPKGNNDRIVTVSQVGPGNKGIIDSMVMSGSKESFEYRMDIKAQEGIAISIKELSGSEQPWVQLEVSNPEVPVNQSFDAQVSILNTTGQPLGGSLTLGNLPANWHVEAIDGSASVENLQPGQRVYVRYKVTVNEVTDGWLPIYGSFEGAAGSPGEKSVPIRVRAVWPVAIENIPDFTYMAPSETVSFKVKVKNTLSVPIQGTVALHVPSGFSVSDAQTYDLMPGAQSDYTFTVTASDTAAEGDTQFTATVNYQGSDYPTVIRVNMKNYNPLQPSEAIDLSTLYNTDGFSFNSSPGNGNLDGAGNNLPADTFPGNSLVRYLGVEFKTPDVSDDVNNILTANNQTITVAGGAYRELALLALATNGDQSGEILLTYEDGTQERKLVQVTDWCGSAAYGEEKVIRFGHRHNPLGDVEPPCGIYYTSLPVSPDKTLVSVTLPDNGNLHFVAVSLVK